jgi:hypothetical protein
MEKIINNYLAVCELSLKMCRHKYLPTGSQVSTQIENLRLGQSMLSLILPLLQKFNEKQKHLSTKKEI